MTDKLHCPWCGDELSFAHKLKGIQTCVCRNPDCEYDGWHFPVEIIQQIIDGKKAQDALKIVDGKLKVIANDENPSPIQSQALDCYIQIAKDCRDTITSITKQEE